MKIDKETPLPALSKNGRCLKYPFMDMKPGESVFFPGQTTVGNAYGASKAVGRQMGWKFAGATRELKGEKGVRIWRIK